MVKYHYMSDLHNNYFVVIGNKLTKISKKKYFEKSGNKESNINKLKRSIYPFQYRDYIYFIFYFKIEN